MKTLASYTEARTTELLNSTGAFFAFGQKQMDEQKVEGVTYVSMGGGLIAPKDNAAQFADGFKLIVSESIAQDIAENGKPAIIRRELANHEAQITMDVSDTMSALEGYDITESDIDNQWGAFFQDCIDNDYF